MNHEKEWTTMIFMAGDNNLSIDMAYSLEKIRTEAVQANQNSTNLFVYYKNNTGETPPVYCDFTDAENPLFVFENEISSGRSNAASSSNVDSLIDFADWCVNKAGHMGNGQPVHGRKANNYTLVLAGHSLGFLSFGLLTDESSDKKMTIPELAAGIKTINDEIIGQKLSILGFDSCLMSMAEIGFEFGNLAETMIASEGGVPNAGWSYPGILSQLTKCRSKPDLQNVVQNCTVSFIEQQSNYSVGGVSADMAAWDLSELTAVDEGLEKLAGSLLKCFEDDRESRYPQMRRIVLQARWNSQTYMMDQNVDLGDFCALLAAELATVSDESHGRWDASLLEVHQNCLDILDGIGRTIIISGFSGGEYQHSTGVSIFFPMSLSAYRAAKNDYENLKFVSESGGGALWNRFLVKYLNEVTLRMPRQVDPDLLQEDKADSHHNSLPSLSIGADKVGSRSHDSTRMPVNPTTRMPVNPTTRMPVNPTTRMPVNPTTRMPVNPTTRMPVNPTTRMPVNPTTRMPVNPTTRMPVNPTTRMPVNPTTRMPVNPTTRMPVNPTTRMPVNPTTRMPVNPTTRMPVNPTTRMPVNPTTRMPVNPTTRMPVNPTTRMPVNPTTRMPVNPTTRMPVNPTTRMPVNPTTRMPVNPTTRMPVNPMTRMPVNPTTRMPVNPTTRMPVNPTTRMPVNPTTRMPVNPTTRMPVNPTTRMPVNPTTCRDLRPDPTCAVSGNRSGGASSKVLQELAKLKNHSSNSLAVGYTSLKTS